MSIVLKELVSPFWFRPNPDDDAEFLIKPLSSLEMMEAPGDIGFRYGHWTAPFTRVVVKYGLLDWKNVFAPDGQVAIFPGGEEAERCLDPRIMHDIVHKIMDITWLRHADKKKSSQPLKLSETEKSLIASDVSGEGIATNQTPPPIPCGKSNTERK